MEQSRLKLRISRMFRASFGSCRTRNIPVDVMEKAVFAPPPPPNHRRKRFQFQHQPLINMSPKARPFPSICKPTCPESSRPIINHTCIRLSTEALRRRRKVCVSDRYSALPSTAGDSGRSIFPPASSSDFYTKNKKKHTKRKGFAQKNNVIKRDALPFSSSSGWWFSSEDETDTLFSSRTLSSDSSESRAFRDRSRSRRTIKKRAEARGCEVGVKVAAGRVKDSFAVVKRSSDPYSDFRTSMVEMIVEKQIFAAKDLEQLLQCFLSLNSHHHHKIILEVFTDIWEALFSNWS